MSEKAEAGRRHANIMIVDDMPANLQLLVCFLRDEGYKVRPVTSGAAALELTNTIKPDLILMDVSMPEMDGFETCRRMKERADLRDVPVVFLSAMGDLLDKIKAFEAGGVDYITKPFHMEEVRIRLETHLHLTELSRGLDEKCRQLEASEKMRTQLVHLLVHDLRTPLFNISASLDLAGLNECLANDPQARRNLADARDSVGVLEQMLADILDVYKIKSGGELVDSVAAPVCGIVADAVRIMGGLMKHHRFAYSLPSPDIVAFCDPTLTARVLVNFLTNAIKHAPQGTEVLLQVEDGADSIVISVTDQSQGVEPEAAEQLFYKMGKVGGAEQSKRGSSGLGLIFSRMVVEAQGGEIGIRGKPGEGCTFWFSLRKPPVNPSAGNTADS